MALRSSACGLSLLLVLSSCGREPAPRVHTARALCSAESRKGVDSIRLDSSVDYVDVSGTPEPFSRDPLVKTLETVGLEIVDAAIQPDAVLTIRLVGRALGSDYHSEGVLYTGAAWEVDLTLTAGAETLFQSAFACRKDPPPFLMTARPPRAPEDAPFRDALGACAEFWWSLVDATRSLSSCDAAFDSAVAMALASGPPLAEVGPRAVPVMLEWLGRPSRVWVNGWWVLGQRLPSDPRLTAIEFFKHEADERSVEPLLRVLEDTRSAPVRDPELIEEVIDALAHQADPRAVLPLIAALGHCTEKDGTTVFLTGGPCFVAIKALGKLRDVRAASALAELVADSTVLSYRRADAAAALGELADPTTLAVLQAAAEDAEARVAVAARAALERIAPH